MRFLSFCVFFLCLVFFYTSCGQEESKEETSSNSSNNESTTDNQTTTSENTTTTSTYTFEGTYRNGDIEFEETKNSSTTKKKYVVTHVKTNTSDYRKWILISNGDNFTRFLSGGLIGVSDTDNISSICNQDVSVWEKINENKIKLVKFISSDCTDTNIKLDNISNFSDELVLQEDGNLYSTLTMDNNTHNRKYKSLLQRVN